VADFTPVRIPDMDINGVPSPHGTYPDFRKRMLGSAGATAAGTGAWIRVPDNDKKLLCLYPASRTGTLGAAVVEVHGAIELADVADNSFHVVLATLNAGSPKVQVSENWSYLRVRVTTPGAAAIQVGLVANEE
jgi:hypothetical protein